jgi:glycosyltransferase involved in cell wall biosynthesis
MHIAVVHNYYQQPGGEDLCVAAEIGLLRDRGHKVTSYFAHNDRIREMPHLRAGIEAVWSRDSFWRLREFFRAGRPQIVHFHNTFPLISPAAYYAARAEKIPIVQTLHNFRLLCGNAVLYRDGQVCEACVGRPLGWPGIIRGCYRGSRPQTAGVAVMTAAHKAVGTWRRAIDTYIALTEFGRRKFVEGGLPESRIVVKPNFVERDLGSGSHALQQVAFVGRLSFEKGVQTLLEAWRHLKGDVPLKIAGDGPLAPMVESAARQDGSIEWLGSVDPSTVARLIGESAVVVIPSGCYEGFPRVIAEGFAAGAPIVASGFGAMAALIEDGRTGLLFRPGDSQDLAEKVRLLLEDSEARTRMGASARKEFEQKYTAEANYRTLMSIYHRTVRAREARRSEAL